jgi:DNA-binding response OmpR family regulator
MKVLVVDDDIDLVDLLSYALRREGYAVVTATDGHQGLARWEAEGPDIVLLDVNLPKLNGFEVCRRIRQDAEIPIIMLTARDEDEDVVRGLQLGADDFVTKPFSMKQLRARIQAVLRRYQTHSYFQPGSCLEVGDLVLDLQSYEVKKAGALIRLTPLEFRILYMLAMNEGRVIPHARLVEYAWGFDGGETSLLKTHICHIRQKLDLPPVETSGIRAVAGVGYTLNYG